MTHNEISDNAADTSKVNNADTANLCRHLYTAAELTPNNLAVAVQKYQGFLLSNTNINLEKLAYQEIDFSSLNKKSDAIAHALIAYGIKPGMKAVLMVTPSIDFFALTFALFKAGIVPILVDPGMGIKNLKQCFIESAPDVFIGIPKAHIARKLFGWGKHTVKLLLTVGGSDYGSKQVAKLIGGISLTSLLQRFANNKPFTMALLGDDEMAAILFTSGSTGSPKGVVYSHKMFEAQITALKNDYQITPGERDLATFPLFSLFGPALGMASIIPDMDASKPIKANPEFIFAAIEKYQCSNLFANPALIEVLGQAGESSTDGSSKCNHLQKKLPSLKRVISAGAPATLSSIKRFTQLLLPEIQVLTSYGATESLPLTKIGSGKLLTTSDVTNNGGGICVGSAIDGVEISIIEITEQAIECWHDNLALPINIVGEIVVKGAMVSQAYYHRDEATTHAKILSNPDLNLNKDKNSDTALNVRHRMGDLGYIDEQGLLWMCGRKAHRVESEDVTYYSIPCERIFNTHQQVKRTALVPANLNDVTTPLICVELNNPTKKLSSNQLQILFAELAAIAEQHKHTQGISHFLIHPDFPVDIRHNAKIFREKLAIWAQSKI